MKKLLFSICIQMPIICFCQSKALVDSINKVIAPDYNVNVDSMPAYHLYNSVAEIDITGDGVKEIVVAASNADTASELNKIFILARKHDKLLIIDSSAAYYVDGSGPYAAIKGHNLTITHNFPRGHNSITYHFSGSQHKYFITKLSYTNIEPNNPDYDHGISLNEVYDIQGQTLALNSSLRSYLTDKITKQENKVIYQKLPKGIGLSLTKMDDPYNYDIFITEGKLYNQMMNY